MSVAWNGRRIEIPGLRTISFLDPGGPPRTPNCNTSDKGAPGHYNLSQVQPISGAVWHTVHGTATGAVLSDGTCGSDHEAMAYAVDFAKPSRGASSQFIVADNGTVLNVADLVTDRCWHAGSREADWNPFTVGIEMSQHRAGGICKATLDAAVTLAWWLCRAFGIQAMIPVTPAGEPDLDNIPRLVDSFGAGARSFYGHWFHAGQEVRGYGDPGPAFPKAFLASGAEGFDLRRGQDLTVWRLRQAALGLPLADQDGIAGPQTVAAIRRRMGRSTWVTRKDKYPYPLQSSSLLEFALMGVVGVVLVAGVSESSRRAS